MSSPKRRAKPTCRCLTCGKEAAAFGSMTEADWFFTVLRPQIFAGTARKSAEHKLIHPGFKLPGGVMVYADAAFELLSERGEWVLHVVDVKAKGRGKGEQAERRRRAFNRNRRMVLAVHGIDIEPIEHSIKGR